MRHKSYDLRSYTYVYAYHACAYSYPVCALAHQLRARGRVGVKKVGISSSPTFLADGNQLAGCIRYAIGRIIAFLTLGRGAKRCKNNCILNMSRDACPTSSDSYNSSTLLTGSICSSPLCRDHS